MSPREGALTQSSNALRKAKAASRPSAASSKETRPPVSSSTRPVVSWSGCAPREGWLTFATFGWAARLAATWRAFSHWRPIRRGSVLRPRCASQASKGPSTPPMSLRSCSTAAA